MGTHFKDLTKKERQINHIKADAVEQFAKDYMKEEGYKVVRITKKKKRKGRQITIINRFGFWFAHGGKQFLKDLEYVKNECINAGKKFSYPDFYCVHKKNKEDKRVMEVKSSDVRIDQVRQRWCLEALSHKGYNCFVFKLPMSREDFVSNKHLGKEVQPSIIEYTKEKAVNVSLKEYFP